MKSFLTLFVFFSLFLIPLFPSLVAPSLAEEALNEKLQKRVSELELKALVSDVVSSEAIRSPKASLGKALFYSKTLSGRYDTACVSCHHPALGGADGLSLPIGVGSTDFDVVGPGRKHFDEKFNVPRNSPTTYNLSFWKKVVFWDGRIERVTADGYSVFRVQEGSTGKQSLSSAKNMVEAQAHLPVTSSAEMHGFRFKTESSHAEIREQIAGRFRDSTAWTKRFQAVYGKPATFALIAEALDAFQASQIFIDSPWNQYLEGKENTLTPPQKKGAQLFFTERNSGGAACFECHSGSFFTDEDFHALLTPQVGVGKGDGKTGTHDYGRERATKRGEDRFAFRTPSLVNVSLTAPYFHAGTADTLEEAIRYHLDPATSLKEYTPREELRNSTDGYERNKKELLRYGARLSKNGSVRGVQTSRLISTYGDPHPLSSEAISDLVAFLESLTDRCAQDSSCFEPWVGKRPQDDPDGNMLSARFPWTP